MIKTIKIQKIILDSSLQVLDDKEQYIDIDTSKIVYIKNNEDNTFSLFLINNHELIVELTEIQKLRL